MTEDQLLNLVAGDKIHEVVYASLWIHEILYCREWTIDYKIDKYRAHGVIFNKDGTDSYRTQWFEHDDLSRLHLSEKCPNHQG